MSKKSFTFTDQRSGAIHESLDFLKPGVSAWPTNDGDYGTKNGDTTMG